MKVLILLTGLLLLTPVMAIDNKEALPDPELQARYLKLSNELRCLVCQNQSIADSTAGLAGDLRQQVRQMLLDGASDDEILEYMVARYGDFVRYRPAFTPRTWALWLGPVALLLVGLAIVAVVVRRYATLGAGAAEE
ncbi:MAG: cytochrome c-type biogenesis protein CcmH [Gammaproteobacteria bacterium]|nr:cytochrome c-type biogenesis protein CcmH [Gammaproteobacteria bacterium]NNF60444.1 cytochrome c-type biogenesis protein CcmH [Gammaproteobacteria bacterium]NNM21790.1 cytochrome c-type biogenesis protein CcmH [Gammaproteobacteria bacterium]